MEQALLEHQIAQLRPVLLRTAERYFSNMDDAEDAVQEACLKLWKVSRRLPHDTAVKPLAMRILKNCCYDMRHADNHPSQTLDGNAEPLSYETPLSTLEEQDLTHRLNDAIRLLPGSEGRIFSMSRDAGMSIEQIALATGFPKSSVTTMLCNARRHLKEIYRKLSSPSTQRSNDN